MWFSFLIRKWYHIGTVMATGANSTPLGRLHPVLQGRQSSSLGSKAALENTDLQAHLSAAKKAASALFPSQGESECPSHYSQSQYCISRTVWREPVPLTCTVMMCYYIKSLPLSLSLFI